MSLTPQQTEAVHRREVSVVLSSGAGCGKTHVLTRRYLSHLLYDGAEVGQIVAITFTERAARQMRDRIRRAILTQLEATEAAEEIARWESHLCGLETAQISTIHAFCASLLRQHAVEAGLDPHFDVLEDFLAVNLETEALTTCLQGLLTATTIPGEDLRQLVLLYGWKSAVEAVRQLVRSWEPGAVQHWSSRAPAEIVAGWREYAQRELLPRQLAYLLAATRIGQSVRQLHCTPCTGPKLAANIATVLEQMACLSRTDDLAGTLSKLKEASRVKGTEMAKACTSKEAYEVVKSALEVLRDDLPDKLALFLEPSDGMDEVAVVGQRFVRVAAEAVVAYEQLKRRHGVVDFQDLLVRARDLLRDRAEVRERLQRRYQFLLIDELQDTDPVQLELVEYLVGTGLVAGKLFAVGDHSQSIYRFRGADVERFQQLKVRMPYEGRLKLTRNFRSQPAILDFANALFGPLEIEGTRSNTDQRMNTDLISTTSRSETTLATASMNDSDPRKSVNPCSSVPLSSKWMFNGLEDYEPLEAHHRQLNPGPCVEFLWSPHEGDSVADARRVEADWIARRIAQMILDRQRLVAQRGDNTEELRPVRPGDVVLLFRAMTNVEIYEAALRRHGLNYYLVGGRAFFAQQEIYDLLNLLRALENPQDSVALAGTLRSPFCCLSDEALFVLTQHPDGLWAGLCDPRSALGLPPGQRERVEWSRGHLERWRSLKNRLPIARLLGVVLADSAFDASTQFEFLGDRKLANLWKLLDLARRFDRSGLFGLAEFIQRLSDLVRAQPREEQAATQPENADVVRLMSIHQAKGLEFPVVFVPDLAASFGGQRGPAARWDARLGCVVRPPADDPPPFSDYGWRLWETAEALADWREDLRTLYVACTRAQDYLVLSAALPDHFAPQTPWMLLLAERFDLHGGQCLVPGLSPERTPQVRVMRQLTAATDVVVETPAAAAPTLTTEMTATVLGRGRAADSGTEVGRQWDAEDGSDKSAYSPISGV
jgi:ATP-dependent helicase/nuclease subunit A